MATEARLKANARYAKTNMKQVKLTLNKNTDADILARLDACPNIAGYIKQLVRADIEARPDLFAE